MSTSTLDTTDKTTAQTGPAAAREPEKKARERAARARRPWLRRSAAGGRRNPARVPGRAGFYVLAALYRAAVLIAGYLLVMVIAMTIIPLLGAWLHQQSGASQGELTAAGTVAMWVMPLLFLVALLTVGTLAALCGMWRWSGRRIAALRRTRFPAADRQGKAAAPVTTTNRQKNRKRSK